MRRIGLYVERQRAWGRKLCEGVAAFAQERRDWSLVMLEREDLAVRARLVSFDGFIARVPDARTAAAFRKTGRPVADLSIEPGLSAGFLRGVEQDNRAVGQLAARHFAERRFVNFAFCGFDGRRFSDERRAAFADALRARGFTCTCYASPRSAVQAFDRSITGGERLVPGADAARLVTWLRHLPKPVAILCANDLRGYQVMHLDRHLTAADVYRRVGLSHTRVNSIFRRVLGTTVQQTIRRTALEESRRLLETTTLPIAEISTRCGFTTPQYFCNVFTSAFGHAPSAER